MQPKPMKLQKLYPFLLTTDLARAEDWYVRLVGRPPDTRPMSTLVQWELSPLCGLGLSTDPEIASRGAAFLIVDDLAAERRRLQSLGILLGADMQGDYSMLAQVHDPDGNRLTLASPPSRAYPPA